MLMSCTWCFTLQVPHFTGKGKQQIVSSNIFLRYRIIFKGKSTRGRCERVTKAAFSENLSSGSHAYWKEALQVCSNGTSENKVRISNRNSSGLKVRTNQARQEDACAIAEVPQEKAS